MSKKVIRLTESQLKEIINDKLAQSYGGDSHSFPHGSGQWNTTEGENTNQVKITEIEKIIFEAMFEWDDANEQERYYENEMKINKAKYIIEKLRDNGYKITK